MHLRPTLRQTLATAALLALAAACGPDAGPPPELVPAGFDAAYRFEVLADSQVASATIVSADTPVFDGRSVAYAEGEGAIYVAEARAWRVRRHPVVGTSPLELGEGTIVASATPQLEGVAHIPTSLRAESVAHPFGRLMVVDEDGNLVVSGLDGALWLVEAGGARARRLGLGPGGGVPREGADLRAVSMRDTTGIAIIDDGDGGALFAFSTLTRIFAAPWDDVLSGGRASIVHIAGSGALGEATDGSDPRRSPLNLRGAGSFDARGGHLVVADDGTRLHLIANFADPDRARLYHLAGGGISPDPALPPLEIALELFPAGLLLADGVGGRDLSVHFNFRELPVRLDFDLDGDDRPTNFAPLAYTVEEAIEVRGTALVGQTLVLADSRSVTLRAYPTPSPPAVVLLGDLGINALSAELVRPTTALLYPTGEVLFTDAASEVVFFYRDGGIDALPYQPIGTTSNVPRCIANVPGTELAPNAIFVGDETTMRMRPVTATSAGVRVGSGGAPSVPLDRLSLGAYAPSMQPRVFAGAEGFPVLIHDVDTTIILSLKGDAAPTTAMRHYAGGLELGKLPITGSHGSQVLRTDTLGDFAVGHDGVAILTMVHRDAVYGDVLVFIASGAARLGGVEVGSNSAARLSGAGGSLPREGAVALEVGWSGVRSVVAVGGGRAVLLREDGALFEITDAGLLERLNPQAATADPLEMDLARFRPPTDGARLRAGPCVPEGSALLLGQTGAWRLDTVDMTARPLTDSGPVIDVACHQGALLLLTEGGEVVDLEADQRQPAPSGASAVTSDGDALIFAHTDARGAPRLSRAEVGELAAPLTLQPLSGLYPSVLHRQRLIDMRAADDGPIFSEGPDGLFYGLLPGVLFRLVPEGSYGINTVIEVLYRGDPLGDVDAPPTAAAPFTGPGSDAMLIAVDGRVYKYRLDPEVGAGEATGANVGSFVRIAGGGERIALGGPALFQAMGRVHGVVADGDGRVFIRWDRRLGYIDGAGRMRGIAGGGGHTPGGATWPFELDLPTQNGFHPPLAIGPEGRLFLAEPLYGVVLGFDDPAR